MSRRTRRFRECFDRLPPDIRSQAKRAYELFRDDPRHPRSPFQKGPPDRAGLLRSGQPRLPRCRRPPRGRDHLVLNRLPCRLRPSPVTALNGELAASDHVADPALPHQAGRVRLPGHLHRRPPRLHAGDPADGRRGGRRASGSGRSTRRRRSAAPSCGLPVGGGASWSGAAVDPETGYLYVPSTNGHSTLQLTEPEPHEQSTLRYIRRSVSADPRGAERAAAAEAAPQLHERDRPRYARARAADPDRKRQPNPATTPMLRDSISRRSAATPATALPC